MPRSTALGIAVLVSWAVVGSGLAAVAPAGAASSATEAEGSATVIDGHSAVVDGVPEHRSPVGPIVGPVRPGPTGADLDAVLDAWFRIDIERIDVAYDLYPDQERAVGRARIVFSMRPGEDRAVFHFAPRRPRSTVRSLLREVRLDGELVDHHDPGRLRRLRHPDSDQVAFEIDRPVGGGTHELVIGWELPAGSAWTRPGWFHSRVDDTSGIGGDALWPTINAPDELAVHRFRIRVHDDTPYVVIGSAPVTQLADRGDGVQRFRFRTDRAVPSMTAFVAAVPAPEVRVRTTEVEGVPVTIVSDQPPRRIAAAGRIVESTLPRLIDDFGPYPAPSLAVLLVRWNDGMEYHGATRTGLTSLRHELVHLWWGTATIGRTWRDIWMDEAIVVWWDERVEPIGPAFFGDLVAGRPVLSTAFDTRAYGRGAAMIARLAEMVGGDGALVAILRDIHERRSFRPFTTLELIDDLVAAAPDVGIHRQMLDWLFRTIDRR